MVTINIYFFLFLLGDSRVLIQSHATMMHCNNIIGKGIVFNRMNYSLNKESLIVLDH